MSAEYDGARLTTHAEAGGLTGNRSGRRVFTPMLIVIIAIGTTDLIFALDSIPAIFGLVASCPGICRSALPLRARDRIRSTGASERLCVRTGGRVTSAVTIPIKAVVDGHEEAAVRLASARLESSLSAASGAPVVVSCAFEPALDSLDADQACVVITSTLAEVANHQEPWPSVERRLRQSYQRLAGRDDVVVFICTVLRHVSADEGAEQTESKRVRIRRLNLLAAEISRETGIT